MSDLVLFCGLGGATEGLVRAGWDIGMCVDAWDRACEAHRRWHPELEVLMSGVEGVDAGDVRRVWASPSCKPWSCANRSAKRGKAHPEYYSLARLVRQVFGAWRGRWLVVENVGGLLWSREGREEMDELRAEVKRWPGLRLSQPKGSGVIGSNSLGVAQLRRRVFLVIGPGYVSLRPGGVDLPREGTGRQLWETDDYRERSRAGVVDASAPSRHQNWTRAGATVARTENQHARTQRAVEAGEHLGQAKTRDGHRQERGGTGRSLAECCALQMVPEWVVEGFTKRVAHELVGNAVPPPVAEHIGRLVLEADEVA